MVIELFIFWNFHRMQSKCILWSVHFSIECLFDLHQLFFTTLILAVKTTKHIWITAASSEKNVYSDFTCLWKFPDLWLLGRSWLPNINTFAKPDESVERRSYWRIMTKNYDGIQKRKEQFYKENRDFFFCVWNRQSSYGKRCSPLATEHRNQIITEHATRMVERDKNGRAHENI